MAPLPEPDDRTASETNGERLVLSRRSFLKAAGLTALAPLPALLPLNASLAAPIQGQVLAQTTIAENVLASPLLERALDELKGYGFGFGDPAQALRPGSEQGQLAGFTLAPVTSTSRRLGALIALSVDALSGKPLFLQYGVAWSLETSLQLRSVLLSAASLEPVAVDTRGGTVLEPGPRVEEQLSFGRPVEDWIKPPAILPLEGWPDDDDANCPWVYAGASGAWGKTADGTSIYHISRLDEMSACRSDAIRSWTLPPPLQQQPGEPVAQPEV